MNWSAIGAIFLALAVGLGAFGAHGLKDRLDAYSLGIWEKAVFYHFIHSLGILIVSMLPRTGTFPINGASSVCWLLCWSSSARRPQALACPPAAPFPPSPMPTQAPGPPPRPP